MWQLLQRAGIPFSSSSFKSKLSKYWDGFLHLLFPSTCICCHSELIQNERSCCYACQSELPFTKFELYEEPTDLDQVFWGRVNLHSTFSLLYYEKTNSVKPILQALKYKGRSDIGIEFGEKIGMILKDHPKFNTIDALIPVPIHVKKRYIRGYNQSEMIAKGICNVWKVKIEPNLISKSQHTGSQTTLGRFKRWDNVENLFFVDQNMGQLQHIAIIDDVVTTGATIESIVRSIRTFYPSIQISVISLALTK